MASDLFVYDASFFSCDPFSPFSDSVSIDAILQTLPDNENEIASATPSSSSPPNHQMGNLSISPKPHVGNTAANGFTHFTVPDAKTEDFQNLYNLSCENAVKMMQRSFSSNRIEGKPRLLCQELSSLENNSSVQIRRVCSTGDLQSMKRREGLSLGTEKCYIEEANTKVRKYSAEERKKRIDKYRAKRAQRNFNKTIKYACRKTLADNRPRIRGRFARNDEALGIPKTATFSRYEDEDEDEKAHESSIKLCQ